MVDLIFNYGTLPGIQVFLIVLAYFLVVIISLTTHEFAHAFAAYKCGDDTAKLAGRLTINPIKHLDIWGSLALLIVGFGWAKPVPINPLRFRNYKKNLFWVSTAGIITNLVLAIVFSLCSYFCSLSVSTNVFVDFLYYFFTFGTSLNLALAIFNLLPVYPLDGYNMVSAITKYDNKFIAFVHKYGQLILLIMIISSLFSFILSYTVGYIHEGLYNFWNLIFGLAHD